MQFRESIAIPAALSSPLDPYPMDVAADGSVWIGTQAGVHVVRPNQGPVDYTAENSPLASNNVRALRFDRATGHLWIATTGGLNRFDPAYVVPVPPPPPRLDVRVWPNPAQLTGAGVQLRLAGNAGGYVGEIYDLGGRRLNRFDIPANGRVFWNGRDEDGRLVPPGVYFVRARAAGRDATVRIALLR
jgi:streptogramin lyase